MLIYTNTLRTFERKLNKLKSLERRKYYLQETLKKINESIDLFSWSVDHHKKKYFEMLAQYPTAKDPETLKRIKYDMTSILPKQKEFKTHVLAKIAELEE